MTDTLSFLTQLGMIHSKLTAFCCIATEEGAEEGGNPLERGTALSVGCVAPLSITTVHLWVSHELRTDASVCKLPYGAISPGLPRAVLHDASNSCDPHVADLCAVVLARTCRLEGVVSRTAGSSVVGVEVVVGCPLWPCRPLGCWPSSWLALARCR